MRLQPEEASSVKHGKNERTNKERSGAQEHNEKVSCREPEKQSTKD